MFDLTGRRLNPDDFPQDEETDEEGDQLVLLADVLGFGNETMAGEISDEDGDSDKVGGGLSEVFLNQATSKVS